MSDAAYQSNFITKWQLPAWTLKLELSSSWQSLSVYLHCPNTVINEVMAPKPDAIPTYG